MDAPHAVFLPGYTSSVLQARFMQPSSSLATRPDVPQPPWSRSAERIAIVAFWFFLAALEFLRRTVHPFSPDEGIGAMAFAGVAVYAVWAALTPGIFWLARRIPLERERAALRLLAHVGIGLGVAIVVELLNFMFIRTLMQEGIIAGPRGFLRASPAAVILQLWFLDSFIIYLAVLTVGFARNYFIQFRHQELEAGKLEVQLADARLSALQMQLNPHFLFNTLNTVSALADRSPEGVQQIVAKLSGLLRRTLDQTDQQEVPLSEELSFLRDYLKIQRIRFEGDLEVTEDIEPGVLDALVPNLVLLPLVENAIIHGVQANPGGRGRIALGARREAKTDRLVLTVCDNGPGLSEKVKKAGHKDGVGLSNTRARLEALYGAEGRLELDGASGGGLLATITLPYHTATDLRVTPDV